MENVSRHVMVFRTDRQLLYRPGGITELYPVYANVIPADRKIQPVSSEDKRDSK